MKQSTPPPRRNTPPAGKPAGSPNRTYGSRTTKAASRESFVKEKDMALSKQNYWMMLGGLGLILIGFFLMSGGGATDKYGFRQITLAPIILLIGFVFEIYAIMWRPKEEQPERPQQDQPQA